MVAAISVNDPPSQRDNGANTVASIKPIKSRLINSKYLSSSSSSSSSRRCISPLLSRTVVSSMNPLPSFEKRSQSVEPKRPVLTPRRPIITPVPVHSKPVNNGGEVSVTSKPFFSTSTRSFSVSFQGETFSLPFSKTKAVPPPNLSTPRKEAPERRKITPLKGRKIDGGGGGDQTENLKFIDQHRWPGRTRQLLNPSTRTLDSNSTGAKKKIFESGLVVTALKESVIDKDKRVSFDDCSRLLLNLDNSGNSDDELGIKKTIQLSRTFESDSVENSSSIGSATVITTILTSSDTESVSSGTTGSNSSSLQSLPRDYISLPATCSRKTIGNSMKIAPSKFIPLKKPLMDSPLSCPRVVSTSRALSSPFRGPVRPMSMPSISSPSRGRMPGGPSWTRNSMVGPVNNAQLSSNVWSILSFGTDVGRGKMGENRILDAHQFRLLHNRHLQWRFINARSDSALFLQRLTAEKNIYNAWVTTSEVRCSVTVKRIKLQLLRQNMKLSSMLKGQMTYLEEWFLLEREHSTSLSGAVESLKASTLRIPVVCGAKADMQNVKDAVGSAVDVMQAMGSSICSLLSKVEEVNILVGELANVTVLERTLLNQCRDLLSTLADMQVNDCSLRTNILQLERLPTRSLTMRQY